ncbi:MAG: hypothetical protein EOP83_25645 [Verrucomicrobiaceae bacterium]|nr:MAG: hypothetical protein EOP83_25645 [Verrucomicrobiaceae bacterium]
MSKGLEWVDPRSLGSLYRSLDLMGAPRLLHTAREHDLTLYDAIFHLDLWDRHLPCTGIMREIDEWCEETETEYIVIHLSLSSRLIAIRRYDQAFMFALRFR